MEIAAQRLLAPAQAKGAVVHGELHLAGVYLGTGVTVIFTHHHRMLVHLAGGDAHALPLRAPALQ